MEQFEKLNTQNIIKYCSVPQRITIKRQNIFENFRNQTSQIAWIQVVLQQAKTDC